jgi:hypothetical protein
VDEKNVCVFVSFFKRKKKHKRAESATKNRIEGEEGRGRQGENTHIFTLAQNSKQNL